MTAAPKWERVSVEHYLAGERRSHVKHEYLYGVLYAMPGARNVHNRIASNVLGKLDARLTGQPCQPFNSDTKIRIRMATQTRFYYPDVSVVCRPNPPHESFQDEPVVITEVVSRRTRRFDEGEKKDGYQSIPTLQVYMVVEQDMPLVTVFRRTKGGFEREEYSGLDAVIPLPEIHTELPLVEIYRGVEFIPEPSDEEDVN
jgi:Uma2 family endonuclease